MGDFTAKLLLIKACERYLLGVECTVVAGYKGAAEIHLS